MDSIDYFDKRKEGSGKKNPAATWEALKKAKTSAHKKPAAAPGGPASPPPAAKPPQGSI